MCKLSVVMSTYREPEEYIRLAVRSVLEQTYTDFEFIIVIDDPENKEMERWLTAFAAEDDRIVILKNEKNLGLVGALNRALEAVRGEFVARMDSDDIAMPDRFEKQLAYLESHKLDLVGALIRRMDEEGEVLSGLDTRHYPPEVIMNELRVTDCVPHPTWLLRREVYERLGGYRLINRCEDYDFLLRALKAGYSIGLCDEYLLNYRIFTKSISQSGLLEQRLTARYLARSFSRLDEVSMDEIRRRVLSKATPGASKRYRKADVLFRTALGCRNPIKKLGYLALSVLTSSHQLPRLLDMAKLRKIRKQGVSQ